MTMLLAEYSAEPIDVLRTVKMVLIHDIVEIDAGDTFIYSTAARDAVEEVERAAADRLFGMLPDDQASEFRALWDEFEARETPESRFARALDRLQPIMLNYANQGGPWREHEITAEQAMSLNMPILEQGAPKLVQFAEKLFLDAQEKGYFHMSERACAIVIEEGQILLMHRRKAGIEYYTVPGGKIEPGETPEEACIREVLEETGITVEITSDFAVLSNLGRIEHYFCAGKLSGELRLGGPEIERQSEANFYEPMRVSLYRLSEYRLLPEQIKDMIIDRRCS
jgi:putative hydrolase of HD superfamily